MFACMWKKVARILTDADDPKISYSDIIHISNFFIYIHNLLKGLSHYNFLKILI